MPLQIVRNNITKMRVDAIVNAANRSLFGGSGIDRVIHRAAGPKLLEAFRALGGCETGQAKATKSYRLPAKYVIHTVGPIWHGGDHGEPELLAACYRNCLNLARKLRCESVAFPMISTGVYGYPKELALPIATQVITEFLMENEMQVYLVVFGADTLAISMKLFHDVKQYIDQNYVDARNDRRRGCQREALWHSDKEKAFEYNQMLGESYPDSTSMKPAFKPFSIPEYDQIPDESYQDSARTEPPFEPISIPEIRRDEPNWQTYHEPERERQSDDLFSTKPLRKIKTEGMTAARCDKETNADRKPFTKIKTNPICASKLTMLEPERERQTDEFSDPSCASKPTIFEWEELFRQTDEGFSKMLLRKIDEKGMTDAQCYKKANVDRKLFSKIRTNPDYRPGKPTVFAFAVALELSLDETKEMLEKAGFALSHSSKMDIVLEFFITNGLYNLLEINEVLFQFDLPLLGSVA